MLKLTINKKWFDMILSGEKKEEYRDIKPYYTSRFKNEKAILADDSFSDAEHEALLVNGYNVSSPKLKITYKLKKGVGRVEWGAEKGKEYYILDILSVKDLGRGRRFAVSDIHGCKNALNLMLDKIKFNDNDILYVIGDMIDRGPASKEVIDLIRSKPNIIPMMGNHEWMMLQYFDDGPYEDSWNHNGNEEMRTWLFDKWECDISEENDMEVDDLISWMRGLPYWIELDDYLLIHAGWDESQVEYDADVGRRPFEGVKTLDDFLKKQPKMDLVWSRHDFYQYPTHIEERFGKKKTVVFGHTQTYHLTYPKLKPKDSRIKFWNDKIDIDCGCAYHGKLACLNLDTMQEYYTEEPNLESWAQKAERAWQEEQKKDAEREGGGEE